MLARRIPYHEIPGLSRVYLEDSYVLDIRVDATSITFALEVVLTEDHPDYRGPREGEHYDYRHALLVFPNVKGVRWMRRSMTPTLGFGGEEPDYGNIDTFWALGSTYSLSGDWGEVEIESGRPVLTMQRR